MNYLEIESKWYGHLIAHSILQDENKILSFENGVFKLYDEHYLQDRVVIKHKDIQHVDIFQYEGMKLDCNCYEAIEYIYEQEWIKMNTGKLKQRIIFMICILLAFALWIWYDRVLPESTVAMINNIFNIK